MGSAAVGIAYLDGPRLSRSLLAAADWVDAGREELNRINVFPVPDGDTGTNFALTLRAVAEGVRRVADQPLPVVTAAMAESCVFAARGNSGMLLSQFLLGFRDALGDRVTATPAEVASAIRAGADQLNRALDEPVEGTILTVVRDVALAAEHEAAETDNFEDLMRRILDHAERSLQHTPDLLAVLKDAGVVDAGAKAFVRVLEGIVRLIEGDPILPAGDATYAAPDAAALAEVAAERDYGFCTEVLVRGAALPSTPDVRTRLRPLGGSIVVLATADLLKIHIHTDTPEVVFDLARGWGELELMKADDMREQHRRLSEAHRVVAVVTDSSSDLPAEILAEHDIAVVSHQIMTGAASYTDGVDIHSDEIYSRMRQGEVFTTSQPTPGSYASAFRHARVEAADVIHVSLAAALSGAYQAAHAAVKAAKITGITIVDSRSASLGEGMLALRAAELAADGWETPAIVKELERVRDQSSGFFTVDTFENLLRSGRVSRGRAWLGGLLDLKPILEIESAGRVVPLDRVRGRDALIPRVLALLDKRLTPRPARLRLGVVHADAPEVAERLRTELVARFSPVACYVSVITPAVGVHAGPGAWGVFYQNEDGTPGGRNYSATERL